MLIHCTRARAMVMVVAVLQVAEGAALEKAVAMPVKKRQPGDFY